jgi:hypothetical protein
MKNFNHHVFFALLAALLLGVYGDACGSSKGSGSTQAIADGATTTSSSGPSRAERGVIGDYDADDNYNGQYEEGDNDDSHLPKDRDNDSDNGSKSYYDSDDSSVRAYGHAVDTAERQTATALVKRYFTAASKGDGATACSLIVASIASSVPEDLGQDAGPLYARGSSCSTVLSKIFKHYHRQIAAEAMELEVTGVRIDHGVGVAVLGFKTLPGRQLRVAREGGVWRINALLDTELP